MPQRNTRRTSSDFDAIDPAFPPPSLKTPQTEMGWDQEKRKKKDKKWSIGGFFRRKKKVSDTDSSSPIEDEEEKKGFLERRRAARKRRNRGSKDVTGSFEHVIINPPRNQKVDTNSIDNMSTPNERLLDRNHEFMDRRQPELSQIRGSSVSLEVAGRKGGRIKTKARVEANRDRLKADSSSDEGGGSSRHSTSSIHKLKSEDTSGSRDGSLSRRSRAARTERYKKRISRDEDSLKDFNVATPSRISRSDERLSNKKSERASSGNRWTAKVVYCESSDYDTKYTAKTKSATPSPIQSPKTRPKNALHYTASAPSGSSYVTFPPSHVRDSVAKSHQELRSHQPQGVKAAQRFTDLTPPRLPKSNSEMIEKVPLSNSTSKNYPSWGKDALNRKSASYDCNVNSLHYVNNHITQTHPTDENVLVIQFPISRPVHKVDTKASQHIVKQSNPPPPPPRDPHRRLVSTNHQDTSPRPMSYAFEDRNPHQSRFPGFSEFGSSISAFQRVPQTTHVESQPASAINKHHRSNSDHHIPTRVNSVKNSPPVSRRPSSVQPETKTHPVNMDSFAGTSPDVQAGILNNYQYFTDQQPRSRKPIHITYHQQKTPNDSYLSDSQVVIKPPVSQIQRTRPPGVQNASDFWKQKDQESVKKVHVSEGSPKLIQRHLLNVSSTNERSRSHSPHVDNTLVTTRMKLPPLTIPTRGTESPGSLSSQSSPRDISSPRTPTGKKLVHNEIGIPVFEPSEVNSSLKRDFRPLSMLEEKQENSEQDLSPMREQVNNPPTPPTRKDSKVNAVTNFEYFDTLDDDFELKEGRRKSSNLEEALNELEAIYKSLRLGEEGYIEKVAKEKAVYDNNRLDPSNWNAWVQSRGFESDSSFNYSRSSLESVDSVDSPLNRSNIRKSGIPDRVTDDMAYRRLNKKDRAPPQEQEVICQAGSFLLVSPTLSPPPFIEPPPVPILKNEPDITLDDVVYRNMNHINNSLKISDPQPPFGIPLGPITPAPNSDYLHVTPKESYRPTFKPRKTPDVVTDDLAFRNLRKDNNKEPLFTPEDTTLIDSPMLRKKRAVRSLSANLLSIIQKESLAMNNQLVYNNNNIQNDLEKSQSFTDVTEANVANGQSSRHQSGVNKKQSNSFSKKNLSGDDSDPTPRGSRIFASENSSPPFTTSTETLTGSKSSLWLQDSKSTNRILSQESSPRLSVTPERRHTTDNIPLQTRKSLSPAKHVPVKLEPLKHTFSLEAPHDFRRSPTPDSHTFTHQKDLKEDKSQSIYNHKESELLAALAREAKEASEQLSRELNELNFDKTDSLNNETSYDNIHKPKEDDKATSNPTETHTSPLHTKPLSIGKITPHKPVKLNTFCITSDNKLENKQTVLMSTPQDIEGSKSMTDLLKELTKGFDLDFENSSNDAEKSSVNTEDILVAECKPEIQTVHVNEMTEQEPQSTNKDLRTTIESEDSDESHLPLIQVAEHKLSTPERMLLSSFPDTQHSEDQEKREKNTSPVNRFPLNIPNDTSDEEVKSLTREMRTLRGQKIPVSCEILPADSSRPSEGCSRDCSSLADEGTKSVQPHADPTTLILCMACAHQLAGLDLLTIFSLILAMASLLLFLIL